VDCKDTEEGETKETMSKSENLTERRKENDKDRNLTEKGKYKKEN
jgi:hypothetical protein